MKKKKMYFLVNYNLNELTALYEKTTTKNGENTKPQFSIDDFKIDDQNRVWMSFKAVERALELPSGDLRHMFMQDGILEMLHNEKLKHGVFPIREM